MKVKVLVSNLKEKNGQISTNPPVRPQKSKSLVGFEGETSETSMILSPTENENVRSFDHRITLVYMFYLLKWRE